MSSRGTAVALPALAGLVLAGCGVGASSSGPPSLQDIALQSGDVPSGFHHCSDFSGRYVSAFQHFHSPEEDQKYWETATNAGALDAWIEVYTGDQRNCNFYGTATNPVGVGGTLGAVQNLVFKYRDEASAHYAFTAGAFIPPVPASYISGKTPPLMGRAIRGTDTGLGTNSYVNIGDLLSYHFWEADWQNGNYIATLYAEATSNDAADTAAVAVNSRIPPPPAAPSAAATVSGSAAGAISGNNLTDVFGGEPGALVIFAFRQDGPRGYYFVKTVDGKRSYIIRNLPPGTYHVIAYENGSNNVLVGVYTRMVLCGYSPQQCKDHTLIDVTVRAGQTVTGINPNDYYINPKTVPAEPGTA